MTKEKACREVDAELDELARAILGRNRDPEAQKIVWTYFLHELSHVLSTVWEALYGEEENGDDSVYVQEKF